tara:strand:+ start:4309 stop:5259 length:951 start_codon:yes stop_codon:yes gene_type:complete
MKINLLLPKNLTKAGWGGIIPMWDLIEHGLLELGHEVEIRQEAKKDEINLCIWQAYIDKSMVSNPEVLNKKNSALFQVEPLDSWLFSYNQVWLDEFEKYIPHDHFFQWHKDMNIWDYSTLNAKYLPEANKILHFDWAFQKDLFKPCFNPKAKRGIFFYGTNGNRRTRLLNEMASHVDIGFLQYHGDSLFKKLSEYSFGISIGQLPNLNYEWEGKNIVTGNKDNMLYRHDRKLESLRMAESLHRGFFTLCEMGTDPAQNEYWSEFCVLSPLLNLIPNAIALLTDDKYVDIQQEKVANFKERTSMARTLERLLDETFT